MKTKRTSIAAVALLGLAAALAACASAERDAGLGPVAPLKVEGEGYRGVILPADAGAETGEADEGTWVPTSEQVRAAERRLAAYVRAGAAEREPGPWKPLSDYHRQYLGTLRDGRRCIYINLLLRSWWESARKRGRDGDRQLVVVFDGGDTFMQAEYDVEANEILWFSVNGEA